MLLYFLLRIEASIYDNLVIWNLEMISVFNTILSVR
jgi:hypothetical protein